MFNIFMGAFLGAFSGVSLAIYIAAKAAKWAVEKNQEDLKNKHVVVYEF